MKIQLETEFFCFEVIFRDRNAQIYSTNYARIHEIHYREIARIMRIIAITLVTPTHVRTYYILSRIAGSSRTRHGN